MMKSIISIALAAVMLLSVLTGCGRKNRNENNVTTTPVAATTAPAVTNTPGNNGNGDVPGAAGNATDRVENGVNGVVNGAENGVNGVVGGVENGVNDVVDGVENGVDDLLGNDGVINGDMNDGRVEEGDAKIPSTPQAR